MKARLIKDFGAFKAGTSGTIIEQDGSAFVFRLERSRLCQLLNPQPEIVVDESYFEPGGCPSYVTPRAHAKRNNISISTVYRMLRKKEIDFIKNGRFYLIITK